MPVARLDVEIDAPPSRVMAVLCDFAAYPRFVPEMEEAVVLLAEPGRWSVRFAVRLHRRLEHTLQLVRDSDARLSWSLEEGAFRANSGAWELASLAGGARTRATYTLALDVGTFVPGSVRKTLIEQNLPALLAAFKARAEAGA